MVETKTTKLPLQLANVVTRLYERNALSTAFNRKFIKPSVYFLYSILSTVGIVSIYYQEYIMGESV